MKKPLFIPTLLLSFLLAFTACDGENTSETNDNVDSVATNVENETPKPESKWGNFAGLVGEWNIDAETAGVETTFIFGEDGSFKQDMGVVQGEGTWEVIDEEHIKIVTQNTSEEGQTWLVTELAEATVNVCWNPEDPEPKVLPMSRVQ